MMTAQRFCELGEALYGASWKAPLSEALNINRRSVGRYAIGLRDVPQGVGDDLRDLAEARILQLQNLLD